MKSTFVNFLWIGLILFWSVGFKSTSSFVDTDAKIYLFNDYLIKTHPAGGIKIYSVADPSHPFVANAVAAEGTHDVAIADTVMYADRWRSLIVYNISDMNNPRQIDSIPNIFNTYDFSLMPMTDVVGGDEGFSCIDCIPAPRSSDGTAAPSTNGGEAGSMARFIIVKDYLYCIDRSSLVLFSIAEPAKPVYRNRVYINWDIETIFAKDSLLFIGGQSGMYVYDISQPGFPSLLSQVRHTRGCDPVVVDDTVAYVTVRNGSACGAGSNQLIIIGIGDVKNPVVLKTYQFGIPAGLAVKNNTAYLCDLSSGLKIYSVTGFVTLTERSSITSILPHDVIVRNAILYAIGGDVSLYNVADPAAPQFLSKLP